MEFKIGDIVIVKHLAERVFDKSMYPAGALNYKVGWRPSTEELNRVGWYVGFTYRYEGVHIPARHGLFNDDYDPAYLQVKNSVKLARIRFAERENERLAFFESITEFPKLKSKKVPKFPRCPSCHSNQLGEYDVDHYRCACGWIFKK